MVRVSLVVAIGMAHICMTAQGLDRELSKIERRIAKQPSYVAAQPLYGLIVFGPTMQTRVWIVLDKSTESQKLHDVAYVDLNGNGDLTDEGERFAGTVGEAGSIRFQLPDVVDTATQGKHTQFSLRCAYRDEPYHMVSVNWNGDKKFGGGYTADPENETYSRFASSPEDAPILWLNGDGPFTFQRWYIEPLAIGQETDVKLFIGVPGIGTSTFCAFQIHALPEREGIEGILHYTANQGEKRQSAFALMNKC